MKHVTRITAAVFAFAMALTLAACGGSAGGSASSSAGSESASASASANAAASASAGDAGDAASASDEADDGHVGKPWITSVLQGNLPAEQPAAKDDLYTHYNYEYLAAHQEKPSSALADCAADLQTANLAVIKDATKSSHDLDQLRIFFNQAADEAKLQETGFAEVQPYLDRIDAVASVEEMNALLAADDFPFSPFVLAVLTTVDTREANAVAVTSDLALVDTAMVGGTYYQDVDDPKEAQKMETAVLNSAGPVMVDLAVTGMEAESILNEAMPLLLNFEKSYGKYVDYNGRYTGADFGAVADDLRESVFTLDELCSFCPNFPMKATLDKLGKGASPQYVASREWAEALNAAWTDENIDAMKMVAKVKVLAETRPFRDPTEMNKLYEQSGQPVADAETFAYNACDELDTFSILLAKTYVDETLGPDAKPRLTEMAQQLVDAYKALVDDTPWIGGESRARVIEKLDHMTLNILEPQGGYYDFGGLELTPTEEGGTLFGNYLKLKQYRLDQESKMVGQPGVPANSWYAIKPTLGNAFYDTNSNSINIFPGYVTSSVYADGMSYQDLLAVAGFTIGHEISHGFDYVGAQLDAYGTPNPVFVDADVDAFVLKASMLARYYSGLEIGPDVMVNGELVVTEAAADLCGMQAVLKLAGESEGADYDALFASISHSRAVVMPLSLLPNQLLDPHPLDIYRVNVSAQMFDPIYDELGVAEGDGMHLAPEERINIWGPNA